MGGWAGASLAGWLGWLSGLLACWPAGLEESRFFLKKLVFSLVLATFLVAGLAGWLDWLAGFLAGWLAGLAESGD